MRPIRPLTARVTRTKTLALTLALASFGSGLRAQERLTAVPTTVADGDAGVLLLEDDGLLAGRITRAANWFVIGRAGGEMQIPEKRVVLVCRSPHEAYEYRRQRLSQPTADAHLTLAEWCLRYDLPDEAGCELESARKLEPTHPRLALLDRRLAATKERLSQKTIAPASLSPRPAPAEQSSAPAVAPDLRNGVLELFSRKVQPVLVNNCTASKCHQPGGQQAFQLNRALLRGEANRRSTMQNLSATLALIDRAHPELSPLLTIPRQTHGGMNGPVFGPRQDQAFKHLAGWVGLVAPPKPAAEIVPTASEDAAAVAAATATTHHLVMPFAKLSAATNQPATNDTADVGRPQQDEEPAPMEDSAVQTAAAIESEPISSLRPPHRLQYGGSLESWRPRDPFDAEIFNRRQHGPPQPQPVHPPAQAAAPEKR